MVESTVRISMQNDNDLHCSYAIICKGSISIIIILKDAECAIFDYSSLKAESFAYKYLLLKHYYTDSLAYKDFLQLIGKMCKKEESSKYFLNHREEDNRMVCYDWANEHMIGEEEKKDYQERYIKFKEFVLNGRFRF